MLLNFNGIISITMLIVGLIIVVTAVRKWIELWNSPRFINGKAVGVVL